MGIDPATTAILVMDYEVAVTRMVPDEDALRNAKTAIEAGRAAGVSIIYGVVEFSDDFPVVHPRNWSFNRLKNSGVFRKGTPDVEVHPDLAPQAGETVIRRRRSGLFASTDLDVVLRAKNIDTLALMGISTGGQVLSAVRAGVDLDYDLYVLSDCCTDKDLEVHRLLMEKVLPMHAKVITVGEFQEELAG